MSISPFTVQLAQISPHLGDLEANLGLHREAIAQARGAGARLVAFPELSLTGYRLRDLCYEVALGLDAPELAELASLSRDIDVVAGFVEESRDHRFYNSAVWFSEGELVHLHRKVYLPTYGLFEEGRFLAAGERFDAFDSPIGRCGLLICEDSWHLSASYAYFLQDVDYLVVLSSGPGRGLPPAGSEPSSGRAWSSLLEANARFFNSFVLYVNRVGYEDGVKFWGGSKALDPFGEVVAEAGNSDPELCGVEVDPARLRLARISTPMRRDERPGVLRRLLDEIGE